MPQISGSLLEHLCKDAPIWTIASEPFLPARRRPHSKMACGLDPLHRYQVRLLQWCRCPSAGLLRHWHLNKSKITPSGPDERSAWISQSSPEWHLCQRNEQHLTHHYHHQYDICSWLAHGSKSLSTFWLEGNSTQHKQQMHDDILHEVSAS